MSGGAGPGKIKLEGSKEWNRWQVDDRLWQEPKWAVNVTSIAWSRDLRFLYVATSGTYGTGHTYKIDLVERKATSIFPTQVEKLDLALSIETVILRIDPHTAELFISLSRFDPVLNRESTTRHSVK